MEFRPDAAPLALVFLLTAACSDDAVVAVSDTGTDNGDEVGPTDSETDTGESGSGSSDTSDTDTDTDTSSAPLCGDDLREDGEECDEGPLNADDWNCMADCTINPVQRLIIADEAAADAADGERNSELAFVGVGSWCNAPGQDLNEDGNDKFELYWDPEEEVPLRDDDDPYFYNWGPTQLAEIADAQYHTHRSSDQGTLDFYMLAYTRQDGRDDTGWFYGDRLTAVPWKALRPEAPIGEWVSYRLAAPIGDEPNTATFFDSAFSDSFTDQPEFVDLTATSSFDWSAWNPDGGMPSSLDYGAEFIKFLSVQTATDWDFEGCVDGLQVWHVDGRQLIIDLE